MDFIFGLKNLSKRVPYSFLFVYSFNHLNYLLAMFTIALDSSNDVHDQG